MRLFEIRKDEKFDSVVANGVIFDSGKCAIEWCEGEAPGVDMRVGIHLSVGEIARIAEDRGWIVIQVCKYQRYRVMRMLTNEYQDECENVSSGLSENGKYLWKERAKWSELFGREQLGE